MAWPKGRKKVRTTTGPRIHVSKRTGPRTHVSKPKVPVWQKQKTGAGISIKRLSTELEIDRNTGFELLRDAKVSDILAHSPLVAKGFNNKEYIAWVRNNIMLKPPFMRVHEARKAAIRQRWSGIWDEHMAPMHNNMTMDQCLDEWIEGLWVEWCRWRVPAIRAEIRHKGGYPSSPFAKSIRHANGERNGSPMDDESEKSICSDSMRHSPSVETVSSEDDDDDDQHNVVPSVAPVNILYQGFGSAHDAARTTTGSRKQPWAIRSGPSVTPDQGVVKRRRLEIQVLEAELARADAKLALQKALLEEAVDGGTQN